MIQQAVKLLKDESDLHQLSVSRLVETAPIGGSLDDPPYLNGAIKLQTSLSAEQLHKRLIQVEQTLGRERNERWASRKIDLDLVGYGNQIVHSETLAVPHPRMSFRPFVLEPLNELVPNWVHPQIGRTVTDILDQLRHGKDEIGVAREILPLVKLEISNMALSELVQVVPIEMARQPKLSILLSQQYRHIGPSVVLPESSDIAWRKGILAAIEAVWPRI